MDDGAAELVTVSGSARSLAPSLCCGVVQRQGWGPVPTPAQWARLCVLGSGSKGNCSVLEVGFAQGPPTRVLIDLGLAPRATAKALEGVGLALGQIDSAVLTHLDSDHCHHGWACGLPRHAEVFVLRGHVARAQRGGLNGGRLHAFEGAFVTRHGLVVRPHTSAHDRLGCAAFRFDMPGLGSVGYATDLGRVTQALVAHLRGVDVLAIESNYCPERQAASARPEFLKRRIMGGHGHLSNAQALDAVEAIGPGQHVVLLHLSRDCNDPELVAGLHEGSDYALTIASQDRPTRWVRLGAQAEFSPAGATLSGPRPAVGRSSPDAHEAVVVTSRGAGVMAGMLRTP